MKEILEKIKSEEGSMLLLTIITITIITIIGVSALNVATTEFYITSNDLNRQKAVDAAEAGIEHAIADTTNQPSISNTFSDGTRYETSKIATPSNFEYFVNSNSIAPNGLSKNIKTHYTYIKNLNQVNSVVIADQVSLAQSGTDKGVISGTVVGNDVLNISGNVLLDSINGGSLNLGTNGSENVIPGLSTTQMTVDYPVPKIDIDFYRNLANGNILSGGRYNLNNTNPTQLSDYDLYFINGNLTITDNLNNSNKAIIVATGDVTLESQLGSDKQPIFIYSDGKVTINGSTNHSVTFDVKGVIVAKKSINFNDMTNVEGALIAPNVSCSGGKWELKYNSNIMTSTVMSSVKLTQNKRVLTWEEK